MGWFGENIDLWPEVLTPTFLRGNGDDNGGDSITGKSDNWKFFSGRYG